MKRPRFRATAGGRILGGADAPEAPAAVAGARCVVNSHAVVSRSPILPLLVSSLVGVLLACSGSDGRQSEPERSLDVERFRESAAALVQRSQRIRDAARAGYQDEALAALPPNPHVGPFRRLDDAIPSEKPADGEAAPPGGFGVEDVFRFEFSPEDEAGFRSAHGRCRLQVRDGVLRVVVGANDYLVTDRPISIPRSEVGEIAIRLRSDRDSRLTVMWQKEGSPDVPWRNKIEINLIADGAFHTYLIDGRNALVRGLRAGDRVGALFLVPSHPPGSGIEIDYLRFGSRYAKYARATTGASYERLGHRWRRALYMVPSREVRFAVRVPERDPTLDFGIGLLRNDAPVKFEVSLTSGDDDSALYAADSGSADSWQDVRLDLAPWAGQDVELVLRVSGSDRNVAFWSNPLLSSAPKRPLNVIVFLEDALRADHLSTQGYFRKTSPEKTRLMANGGVVFVNAFSQATKTRPSIPSIMTSLLPTATGIWGGDSMLDDSYLTLAEIMRGQGFRTAAFIQNGNAGPMAGLHQGFEELAYREVLGRADALLGEPLAAWLARYAGRNFFLYLHAIDPHGEYDPPPPFDRWYRALGPGGMRVERSRWHDPDWVRDPTVEGRRRLYDGEVRYNDSLLPRLLRMLDELGLREHTLIVFTSDHGEYLGDDGLWEHHPPGLRPVTHVPLMLYLPGRFEGGRRIFQNVQSIDILPTILELAGVDRSPLLLQGDSLVDLLEGRRTAYWNDRLVVSEEPMSFYGGRPVPSGSFLLGDWHLIASRYRFKPGEQDPSHRGAAPGELQLLRIRDGSGETRAPEQPPPRLAELYWEAMRALQANDAEAWLAWTAGRSEKTHKFDPDTVDRLRELGYME